ncbi:hypothetical protein GF327_08180 [Candidatus Woesearchaeota archaeon]|nr:hypothetical protein [Candidatus Woesearchaeota archaeon]
MTNISLFNNSLNNSFNSTSTVDYLLDYFYNLPESAASGNISSIIISLILFFILIVLLKGISTILLEIMKRTIILVIVILVLIDFIPRYIEMVYTDLNIQTVLLGMGSLIIFGFGLYIALRSLFRSTRDNLKNLSFKSPYQGKRAFEIDSVPILSKSSEQVKEDHIREHYSKQTSNIKDMFTKHSLKSDKSLVTVLIYLIVAEFGVFSSPTLAAPNIKVGLLMFLIFIIGIILFVRKSYSNLKTGYTYLVSSFVVGIFFAFILGIVWGSIPIEKLLSLDFFASDSLIALISGMSVSLFAGSKG